MKRLLFALCLAGFLIVLVQCGDDTVEPPTPEPIDLEDILKADSTSGAWFRALYDTMLTMADVSADDFRDVRFTSMRSGFLGA